jgi:hypothetical protein
MSVSRGLRWNRILLIGAAVGVILCSIHVRPIKAAAGPGESTGGTYRVLAPIESGNLLLFPVVRETKSPGATPFLTLDEGIKSGQVEVTEAGKVRGLVRPRPAPPAPPDGVYRPIPQPPRSFRGDQVNTLVLLNNSDRPLLLLAGEIVTGGKQDRVIAKDRIVPSGNEPVDLGVFCIEPGRWTESSATFGASAKAPANSIMVQPTVREKAMVAKDQQEVWNSVHGTIDAMATLTAPSGAASSGSSGGPQWAVNSPRNLGTTSYAQAMKNSVVSAKVDEAAAPVMQSREQLLNKMRQEHAVGVVVAVRGEIVWADLFADTDLLARYWTKLIRSYAAESLLEADSRPAPTVADAQHFLDAPAGGTETTEGDLGIYRYRELHSGRTETFVLESLLPGTGYDVHISKLRLREGVRHTSTPQIYR